MRALVQRCSSASVSIPGEAPRGIGTGLVVLLGVGHGDDESTAARLWDKIRKLRIFADADGKTNLSVTDVGGEVLVVSQFTLYASCRKGNRPSFTDAAAPDDARALVEHFTGLVRESGIGLETGWFGADMDVELVNDGPFTIWLDTDDLAARS